MQTLQCLLDRQARVPWENEEMRSALEDRVQDRNRRVVPVLLPGAPDNKTSHSSFLEKDDFGWTFAQD